MRKKRDESTKPAGKGTFALLPVLFGTGMALVLLLLATLLLASLICSGTLSAALPSFLLSVCGALCAFVGARVTIGLGDMAPMIGGAVTGLALCLVAAAVSVGCRGGVVFHGQFLATLMMLLAGGCLAGLFGKRKPKTKKKK